MCQTADKRVGICGISVMEFQINQHMRDAVPSGIVSAGQHCAEKFWLALDTRSVSQIRISQPHLKLEA